MYFPEDINKEQKEIIELNKDFKKRYNHNL